MSDEFNNGSFNTNKWSKDGAWIGRPPGLFVNEQVTVGSGPEGTKCLKIANRLLKASEKASNPGFTHAGGRVESVDLAKPGYYMECRMRTTNTFMSSTFFLRSDCVNTGSNTSRRIELDIHESIGKKTTAPNSKLVYNMASNTHAFSSSKRGCRDQEDEDRGGKHPLGGKASNGFHVFGAWWKSPTEIKFYLDGVWVFDINPAADFDIPMGLRMVSETYNWNAPKAGSDGMDLPLAKRTAYYDWVRVWKLSNSNSSSSSHFSIPGTIQAEKYSTQKGTETQSTSDKGGGKNVSSINSGDYMTYDINVSKAGCYKLTFRVASSSTRIKFDIKKGTKLLGSIDNPTTGGHQDWKNATKVVRLPAGKQKLKIVGTGGNWKMNWIKSEPSSCK